MPRSTKGEKAQQLNAARGLLQRRVALPEAVRRLSREFNLSERQAYLPERSLPTRSTRPSSRSHGAGHLEASAANGGTAAAIRQKQWLDHRSHRNRRVACVPTLSQKAWLSRVKVAAPFKSRFLIRSIAGSSQSSRRLTTFWFPVGSAPSACA